MERRRFFGVVGGAAGVGFLGGAGQPRDGASDRDGPDAPGQGAGPGVAWKPLERPEGWRDRPVRVCLKYGMIGPGETLREKFDAAREAGFEGVELDSPNGFDTDDVLAAKEQSGIEIPGVIDSVHWTKPLTHPDEAVRAEGREALKTAVRDCAAYGGDTVLLVAGVVNGDIGYAEGYERALGEIGDVLKWAKAEGLEPTIAIENVWNNFLLSPVEARRFLMEALRVARVGLSREERMELMRKSMESPKDTPLSWYFDVGNVWAYGWPEHWLEALGPGNVARLDIKGYSRAKADKEGKWAGFGVEIGDGDVPWESVRDWISRTNWYGWASAEVGGGDMARLKDIRARVDRALGL